MLLIVLAAVLALASGIRRPPRGPSRVDRPEAHPGIENCTIRWFTQDVDHFGWQAPPNNQTTYQQRFFVCNEYWKGGDSPIFFYTGNEADVELYVNNTGLMWESAPMYGALMIFAEHRYFGESLPFGADTIKYMNYLSAEQALADYATLIYAIRQELNAFNNTVIAFGGSYGGMLASWLRIKYPNAVDGSIAGSAPIVDFLGDNYNEESYSLIETMDASSQGGATDSCSNNIRKSWQVLFRLAETTEGLQTITQSMKLCQPVENIDNVTEVAYWAQNAFSFLAMGSYPYPSSYMTNGGLPPLPPYPMRVGCGFINGSSYTDAELLTALANIVGIFYNYTGTNQCNDINASANNATQQDGLFWDYLACSEFIMPMSSNGINDMFWSQPWSLSEYTVSCQQQWGITPRPYWVDIGLGGTRITSASNIVFSNGELDPWRPGGIQESLSDSLIAVVIADVGHHIDLMFSNPADPPQVIAARNLERSYITQWIAEVNARHA